MPGELTVPLLYRKILRAAKLFPSIKRKAIIEDIKVEFREGQARHAPKIPLASSSRSRSASQSKLQNLPMCDWRCCGCGTKCAAQAVLNPEPACGWFRDVFSALAVQRGTHAATYLNNHASCCAANWE